MKTVYEGSLSSRSKMNFYGFLLAMSIIGAVVILVLFLVPALGGGSAPKEAPMVMTISAIASGVFLLWALYVRKGADFDFKLIENQGDLIWKIDDPREKKEISGPIDFKYFHYDHYVGKGVHMHKLILCIAQKNECILRLEDTYGWAFPPPETWPKVELNEIFPYPKSNTYKYINYVPTGKTKKLTETLVDYLVEKKLTSLKQTQEK